jgi:aspartate aminotransferase
MELSKVAAEAEASATLALNARAKALARDGVDVVSFTVGEPDFPTPENIRQAAIRAIQAGFTHYTPAAGMPELREAISQKFKDENDLDYGPDQVLVSSGGKHCLFQVMMALVENGDEVLLPAPYWVSYASQARFCGATPVVIDCTTREDLKLTPELLRGAITPKSKLLVLNSPSNPTGVVMTDDELRAVVEVALEHDLWIISDEIYERLVYDGLQHTSPAAFSAEAYEHVVTMNGVSKTYAMTGWRIGYAGGPEQVIQAAARMQSNMTSAPSSISQKAALEAITGPQDSVDEMREAFDERRHILVDGLNNLPGVECEVPQGAFYAFPDVSELLGRTYCGREVNTSMELAGALLDEVNLAVVPGAPFGAEGYLRFSYATGVGEIEKGVARLGEFIDRCEG